MNKSKARKQQFHYVSCLSTFLCYLVVCLIFFFAYNDRCIRQTVKENLSISVEQQVSNIMIMLDEQFNTLTGLASYISVHGKASPESIHPLLAEICENSHFSHILISDTTGNAYDPASDDYRDISSRDYFQEVLAGHNTISDPVASVEHGDELIILAVPIQNRSGTVTGVLAGAYNVSNLCAKQSETSFENEGFNFIFNADGEIIAQSDNLSLAYDNFFDYLRCYSDTLDVPVSKVKIDFQTQGSRSISFVQNKHDYYISYMPLGINDWYFMYLIPSTKVLAGYKFIQNAEVMLAIAILVGIIAMFLQIFRISGKERDELTTQAQIDELTGLKNRKALQDEITLLLTNSSISRSGHAFLICDIDNFKRINDTYGHAVGDIVLKEFSHQLQRSFRNTDIIGRLGGDEFVVFLCRVADEEAALHIMNKFMRRLSDMRIAGYPDIRVGSSMGMSFSVKDGNSFDVLYQHADAALYESKRGGKGILTFYRPEFTAKD